MIASSLFDGGLTLPMVILVTVARSFLFALLQPLVIVLRQRVDDGDEEIDHHQQHQLLKQ